MSHVGSVGLDGAEEEDMGRKRTNVELSQPSSNLGEYAGVDGSESIKVSKDLADMGGDFGPGDFGLDGGEMKVGVDRPILENRCG